MMTTLIASAILGAVSSTPSEPASQLPPLGLKIEQVNAQGEFNLQFVNESDSAIHLNLGNSYASGVTLHPSAVKLIAESGDTKIEWLFAPSGFGRVTGRREDFIVSLAPKASYQLVMNLNQYSSKGPGGRRPIAGEYKITAHFVGTGPVHENPDMAGTRLMKFWEGGAYSTPVSMKYQPE